MSFYSEASLAYVASAGAGKDGKAYSMKPVDGTGDFTFSRGSNLAATRVGPTGLIEKGRENLFTNSNTLTGVTLDNLTRTTGHADPFGGNNAALLTENTSISITKMICLHLTMYIKINGNGCHQPRRSAIALKLS